MKPDGVESRVGSSRLNERVGLRRRTGWGFGGQAKMGEDFGNDRGIFDGGDEGQNKGKIPVRPFDILNFNTRS